MSKVRDEMQKLLERIRESEAYNQLKTKYDELDSEHKLYVNLGGIGAVALLVLLSLVISVAKLDGMKSDINEREEMIGYLQRSADSIKQLKAQQLISKNSGDANAPVGEMVDSIMASSGIDHAKVDVGAEHPGVEDKDSREMLLDVKMTQINLKQLTRFLFGVTDRGSARNVNIKDLMVDTKGDPSGYIDATVTLASFKAK